MKRARVFGMLAVAAVAGATACSLPIAGVQTDRAVEAQRAPEESFDAKIDRHSATLVAEGRRIFRYDTFGSEVIAQASEPGVNRCVGRRVPAVVRRS
jgi:hypothetical protein